MKSLVLLALIAIAPSAWAGGAAKKYHFELTKVLVKDNVKADVGKSAQPRIEAQLKKAFETNPQLVAKLDGAPDPGKGNEAYRRYLTSKGIAGSYLVTVELTDAQFEVVPLEEKHSQRISVKVAIHMLGEVIPEKTMGFSGDGQATVKVEVGMKLRDKDSDYAWDSAAETAIADAMKTCFAQLAKGGPKVPH